MFIIRDRVLSLLRENGILFEHLVHEATPTSEDSARVRGTCLEEGVKSLILVGKNSKRNFQVNVPSNRKLDMGAVREVVGEKCQFESAEVIFSRWGLEVGGVPPFGILLEIPTFFDQDILLEKRAAFNCGLKTESVVMQSNDLVNLIHPQIGKFALRT